MVIGAALVELHVHDSRSLKTKRGVVRRICQRVRNRFNLSIAEVGGQDTWQRAVLGLAAAGSDHAAVRRRLERAVAFVEELHVAEVIGSDVELLALPFESATLADADEEGLWDDDDDDGPAAAAGGEEE